MGRKRKYGRSQTFRKQREGYGWMGAKTKRLGPSFPSPSSCLEPIDLWRATPSTDDGNEEEFEVGSGKRDTHYSETLIRQAMK